MPSTFDELFDETANPVLMDEFGESVLHFPGGSGSGVSVTAIVEFEDPDVVTERGKETRQRLKLSVAASVTCLKTDVWTVRGVKYQAVSVQPADAGLQLIQAQSVDVESRYKNASGVL